MQEVSNFRSCLMFYVLFICFVPFINGQGNGDLFNPHAQLLQSFQNEMKSLEAAAHRVNALLMNPNLNNNAKQTPDQVVENTDANPVRAEKEQREKKPFEITVLANPGILRNGILKVKQPEATTSTTKTPEIKQHFNPNPLLNFGPLGSFFNTFASKTNFPVPWWRGKNVCIEKSDKTEDEDKEETRNQEPQFVIFGTGSFERCSQTANKYVCTTVLSTPESTKTTTMTYACCEGYRREGNECVKGDNSLEKSSSSDESSTGSVNSDDKSEIAEDSYVLKENKNENNYQFVPIKVTVPQSKKNIPKKEENQSVDKSFSSQSEEEDGNPVWLQNYLNGQRLLNLYSL